MRRHVTVAGAVASFLAAAVFYAGPALSDEVSGRCAAAIDHAAAQYSACLLRAEAHAARKPRPGRLANREARCEDRFERQTQRTLRRHRENSCTSSEQISKIARRTEAYAANVAKKAQDETAIDLIYVQTAAGATITDATVILSGVSAHTGWVSEETSSEAGSMTTTDFLDFFGTVDPRSFIANPPKATLSCSFDAEPSAFSVTLHEPEWDETAQELRYAVEHHDFTTDDASLASVTCDGQAYLFIDPALCVPAGAGCAEQAKTNNTETINLLKKLAWDTGMEDWVYEQPPQGQGPVEDDPFFRAPVKQINSFAVFGDWLYQCLSDESEDKRYLEYFMGTSYASENFIWNQTGLLPAAYKTALPIIRGSEEFLPGISTWDTDSQKGKQFPVLNSAAADTVIALVMHRMKKPECAIGFGQWQQTHVSGSILSAPWSIPVDTDQNPVVFKDASTTNDELGRVLNRNRHKFVLGPITWLSMALDIRAWDQVQADPEFEPYFELGRKKWATVHDNVDVNRALCQQFAEGSEEVDGPYPPEIAEVVETLMPNLCQVDPTDCKPLALWQEVVQLAASGIEATMCTEAWKKMDQDSAKAALLEAQSYLRDRSAHGGHGPSVDAINEAAMIIERFYFGPNLDRVPFLLPLVSAVDPPVTVLPPLD